MIRLIEALNFRCLKYVRQELGPFHALVGPNASGKTTFLDVVTFLSKMINDGIESALHERTNNFYDLLWNQKGSFFELAVEAIIPDRFLHTLQKKGFDSYRYEIKVGFLKDTNEPGILEERALLKTWSPPPQQHLKLFPRDVTPPQSILANKKSNIGVRTVLSKTGDGYDHFYSETVRKPGKGWYPAIRLGPKKSALANLHEDETKFPISSWFKRLLSDGVQSIILNSLLIRRASPPGQGKGFKPDGSNLPWVIEELKKSSPKNFLNWIRHIQTALPDVEDIRTVEREDDRHRYIKILYNGGLQVPSWMASDGTLRLLALTLPAYIGDMQGIYLIEEPENGVHPKAVKTIVDSLSSVYDAQVLLATHSPVILGDVKPSEVLCFTKDKNGATDIIIGSRHPKLRDWKGTPNLDVLFAGGVLG